MVHARTAAALVIVVALSAANDSHFRCGCSAFAHRVCGDADDGASAEITVVAGTTEVADLARNVAGDRAEVVGLLAANSDPHDYEPRPSDAEAVGEADLVVQSGGDVDLWLDEISKARAPTPPS